jgi:hypothetical protein
MQSGDVLGQGMNVRTNAYERLIRKYVFPYQLTTIRGEERQEQEILHKAALRGQMSY